MDRQMLDKYRRLELEHWWFRVRERILTDGVRDITRGRQGLRILNVGAATGRSTEFLQPFGAVSSVEYDGPSYQYCRDVLKLDIVQASINDLPFESDSFDLVCCFDVIEHVEDDAKGVQELVRVCKPGGTVFLTTPAYMSLWSDHDRLNHHFRRYLMPGITGLFDPSMGKPTRKTYFNALLFPPIWLVRRMQQLLPKRKQESLKPDNEYLQSPLTDRIFGAIFSCERWLLRVMDFPFGVSIMLLWGKTTHEAHLPITSGMTEPEQHCSRQGGLARAVGTRVQII